MKFSVIGAICVAAALALWPGAVASAQDGPACSSIRVAGEWGYSKTGTIVLPTGAVPFASLGKVVLEAGGNVWGTQEASVGGTVANGELRGTFTVNPDCTGTATVGVYDPSGPLLRMITMSLVFDDKATEVRMLVTSLMLPNGTVLPSVIIGNAKRMFQNHDGQ